MSLAGQVHSCTQCGHRLPIDNLVGSVTVICRHCKQPVTVVLTPSPVRV